MPQPWPAREVAVVPPIATARAMFERAERFDTERGGRFDRRSARVLIWSTNAAAADSGEPIGGFYVRWHDPTGEQATIWKVERDPAEGGSAAEAWRAVEVLAGGLVLRQTAACSPRGAAVRARSTSAAPSATRPRPRDQVAPPCLPAQEPQAGDSLGGAATTTTAEGSSAQTIARFYCAYDLSRGWSIDRPGCPTLRRG